MQSRLLPLACLPFAACTLGEPTTTTTDLAVNPGAIEHGRAVWFETTYGGEKFFAFLKNHPDPARRIDIGFHNVAETPRDVRFDVWGVINDPDCVANPDGGLDLCDDPESSGIIGIRKKTLPNGAIMFGAACAACHAGFDPVHPPADPNDPGWDNIHATIGNSYIQFGDIFGANLAAGDPRAILFAAWPPGSVDTTLLFSDNIMNPGVVTHFWAHQHRPRFEVGLDEPKLRNGQGGEDDVGGDLAAIRVYTNIGVCFAECTAPAVATGQPIDVAACRQRCPDFPPQEDLDDMGEFLASHEAPQLPGPFLPGLYQLGRRTFDNNCASCHDRSGELRFAVTNDEVNPLAADPANATNACRSLTSNWEAGKLWAQFSSQVYKDRVTSGDRGYRTMPLAGIWATSPLLHNQSIGETAPADAHPWERVEYFWDAMWELLSDDRTPEVLTLPVPVGPFPAGTPLQYVFSRDPATGQVLCTDVVENRGHYFGADLRVWEKVALIHWLQYQ
jgi:hypothetical protein